MSNLLKKTFHMFLVGVIAFAAFSAAFDRALGLEPFAYASSTIIASADDINWIIPDFEDDGEDNFARLVGIELDGRYSGMIGAEVSCREISAGSDEFASAIADLDRAPDKDEEKILLIELLITEGEGGKAAATFEMPAYLYVQPSKSWSMYDVRCVEIRSGEDVQLEALFDRVKLPETSGTKSTDIAAPSERVRMARITLREPPTGVLAVYCHEDIYVGNAASIEQKFPKIAAVGFGIILFSVLAVFLYKRAIKKSAADREAAGAEEGIAAEQEETGTEE